MFAVIVLAIWRPLGNADVFVGEHLVLQLNNSFSFLFDDDDDDQDFNQGLFFPHLILHN